jgi:cell shape-determining protein MreC
VDYQVLFNLAVSVAGFFAGWTLNNITKALERLDNDVRDLHKEFVDKEDYHRDIDELKDICKQIFAKLDNKADKA